LARLNRNPRDIDALVDAGNGALAMGDTDAAVSFFTRADRLSPGTPRIEAGLAGAKVMAEDPLAALPLFGAADRGGPLSPPRESDRGLAYDLVGDNAAAQAAYRDALAGGANDEASRRLALSLAISGDEHGAELILAPLLQKQDRAAWRTRAFALAILGKEEDAVTIARATMPEALAIGIAPYLRYMRRLTHAQQAAAANLGHFPQPAEIGIDDPAIVAFHKRGTTMRLASTDTSTSRALTPAGHPLGVIKQTSAPVVQPVAPISPKPAPVVPQPTPPQSSPPQPTLTEVVAARAAPPEPTASRESTSGNLAVLSSPAPGGQPLARPPIAQRIPASAQVPAPVPTPAPATATAEPTPPPVAPSVPAAPAISPAPKPSFAEAFAAFGDAKPETAPAAGAVDIRKIKPRPVPKTPAPPPPPPVHPSRIWVQVGVGRDSGRLAFDWRHMVRDEGKLFKGKSPSFAEWGRTKRLLVGPFDSDEAAHAWLTRAKPNHPDAFVWTSSAGQVVDPLEGE